MLSHSSSSSEMTHVLFDAIKSGDARQVFNALKTSDPNVKDSDGNTSLHIAAINFPQSITLLKQAEADVNIKNNAGLSPLMLAASKHHLVGILALLNAGAAEADLGENYCNIPVMVSHDTPEFAQHTVASIEDAEENRRNLIREIEKWKANRGSGFLEGAAPAASLPAASLPAASLLATSLPRASLASPDPAPTPPVSRATSWSTEHPLSDSLGVAAAAPAASVTRPGAASPESDIPPGQPSPVAAAAPAPVSGRKRNINEISESDTTPQRGPLRRATSLPVVPSPGAAAVGGASPYQLALAGVGPLGGAGDRIATRSTPHISPIPRAISPKNPAAAVALVIAAPQPPKPLEGFPGLTENDIE